MKITMQSMALETFAPMLRSLSHVLDKGAELAKAKNFDSAVLANARLAPDMLPLGRQVQIACDHAKNGTARLTGREPPHFEDNEQTLDELKARIEKTLRYLETVDAAAFEGAEERVITIPLPPNVGTVEMNGLQYLRDWAFPNFYFHVVTAYDILRHNGVEIGKPDYLAHAGQYIRPNKG